MNEQVKYYVCEATEEHKACPHAMVHSHSIGGISSIDVALSGHCTRKDKTTTCVEATDKQIIMARITGKI